jgi:hypothetical protein
MKRQLKYILLLLVFLGTLKQSNAQSTISSSVTLTQSILNGYTWPVTINAGSEESPLVVTLGEDVTLSNALNYFVINGEYVTIDGNGKNITLSNITNYRGLVANGNYPVGSWSSSFSNSIVKNIGVLSNNSSLNEYCGWIGQQGYGNGASYSITYCYSNGNMTNTGSGGILGQAYTNGTISNSYSLGNISGSGAAGIIASMNSDASRTINCYANGTISGSNANGICQPNMFGGASFTNCYAANGVFNTTTANSNLTGTDGTVWNTSVTPYTLSVFKTTISSSVTLTQSILNGYTWPVTINAGSSGSPLVVTLGEDVTLSNALNYFVINGDYVTFEGNNKTITLSGVTDYPGLINNGKSNANGFNNLIIQNLGVLSNNSTLKANAGWIGQQYFSINVTSNVLSNCYSTGSISSSGGGIIGSYSSGGINNCYSTGSIGRFAGGIAGSTCINISTLSCYSTGSISEYAGGIVGSTAYICSATNCYSTGDMGNYAGGIFGMGSESCFANNCYSGGKYLNNIGDGIFGSFPTLMIKTSCYVANGVFNSTTANSNLTGTDGTVWNTNFNPYRLSVFFPSPWGLSPNGLKTQDNTIQLDINGKKGTSSPVNENGKVN